jgi:hypothetical protein
MSSKYPNKNYYGRDTYESLVFNEPEPKPTDELLKGHWEEIKDEFLKGTMRHERNMLLVSSDFTVVSDYPDRDKWLIYRQKPIFFRMYFRIGVSTNTCVKYVYNLYIWKR